MKEEHFQSSAVSLFASSAVERSFKIQGTIHTKLRNRLTAKVCQKLTFIRVNPTPMISNHESILSMMDPDSISSDPTNDLDEQVTQSRVLLGSSRSGSGREH
jgi:hypothetical protein